MDMEVRHAFSEFERELPQNSNIHQRLQSLEVHKRNRFFNAQDWPTQPFSGPRRLEAIEEGRNANLSTLELTTIKEKNEEPSYFPSYFQALSETFESNNIYDSNVVAMGSNNKDLEPPSQLQYNRHNGLVYEPSCAHSTMIQKYQYSSAQSSLQGGSSSAFKLASTTTIQNERLSTQSSLQDGLLNASHLSPTTPIQEEQSNLKISLQNDFNEKTPSSATTTFSQNDLWKEDSRLGKKASETMTLSVDIEGPKICNIVSTNYGTIENHKPSKEASESTSILEDMKVETLSREIPSLGPIEGQNLGKRASEPNKFVSNIEGHNLWNQASEQGLDFATNTKDLRLAKRLSETLKNLDIFERSKTPNISSIESDTYHTTIKDSEQNLLMKMNAISNTSDDVVVDSIQKFGERLANESNSMYSSTETQNLRKSKAIELSAFVANNEAQDMLWRRSSAVDCTPKLGDNDKDIEIVGAASNDFAASSLSTAVPIYIKTFDGTSHGQRLWRRVSTMDWSNKLSIIDDEIQSEEVDESSNVDLGSSGPVYVNHFADFVKLAMGASSSTAKGIIASASLSASSSASSSSIVLNPPSPSPLECETLTWLSRLLASSLFTEAPKWIIRSKNADGATTSNSPTWITVIKDGVDSRKNDKQWEEEKIELAKGRKFS